MPARILIADDDLHTRRILQTLLSREPGLGGPEIVAVADGQEGIAALDKGRFDLVITDLLMPKMDGWAFARALRQHGNGGDVPLFVTSAVYKDKAALAALEQETGGEFFAKPYQLRELVRSVLRILVEPHKPKAPSPKQSARPEPPQSGLLSEKPLPSLLMELIDAGATGVLSLTRARVKKEVFLYLGHPIGAESNLRNETLGELLLARGAIDAARLGQALELSRAQRGRLGAILVEKGWIKEAEVLKYLTAQVRLKVVSSLRWRDGEYRYIPGDSFSGRMTHLRVDGPRLVLTGLKRTALVEEIARTLMTSSGRVQLAPSLARHRALFEAVYGPLSALLTDRPRPSDVAARGDAELLLQCDALLMSGLATLDRNNQSQAQAPSDAPPAATEPAAGNGAVEGTREKADPLYAELFSGDEEGAASSRTEPFSPRSVELVAEDSGVFALPQESDPPRAADPATDALREEVLREYLGIHGSDYYQMLRLRHDATDEEIGRAFAEREHQFRLERFRGVDLGRDHGKLEELAQKFQEARDTLAVAERRAAYDQSLASRAVAEKAVPVGDAGGLLEAEGHFREGLRLLSADQAVEAMARLRDAVRAAPDQGDYHAVLGWAVWKATGEGATPADAGRAEAAARACFAQALSINPDNAAAHEFAGRVAFVTGDDARAADHLERALHIEPHRTHALATLEAAMLRSGDFPRLERQYRNLIGRLGNHQAESLWWDLAVLLRDQLGKRRAAYAAFETYARLVPDDARAVEAMKRLRAEPFDSGEFPSRLDWRSAATALRTAFIAGAGATPSSSNAGGVSGPAGATSPTGAGSPDGGRAAALGPSSSSVTGDLAAGQALFRLHLDGGRPDEAFASAAALHVRGNALVDDPAGRDAEAFYQRYRPRFLQRAPAAIPWPRLDALRHADDDRDLGALFGLLFAAVPPAYDDPAPGMPRLAGDDLPPHFGAVLRYVAWLLGVGAPSLVRAKLIPGVDAGAALALVPVEPPLLVAGPETLHLDDKTALAFRLARTLSSLHAPRAHAAALSSTRLKAYLAAAMSLTQGSPSPDADPEVLRLRQRLAQAPELTVELRPLLERIASRGATLNLSRWSRGIARTAERIALLVCGDLCAAHTILVEEESPAAAAELLEFSLSDALIDARRSLGLSIAV